MGTLQTGLADAWSAIMTFVPKLVMFLIILLIGWLIAKGLSKAVQMLLAKIGFGRLLEKSGLGSIAARTQLDAGDLLVKLVYYFILLIFVQLALGVFGPNPVSDLITRVVTYLPRVLVALVLVLVAAAIGRGVADVVRSALGQRPIGSLLGRITFAFILALGIIAALNQLEIGLTVTTPVLIATLATIGGVIVVGVGGGLIDPMRQRWGRWLDSMEEQFGAAKAAGAEQAGTSGGTETGSGSAGASSGDASSGGSQSGGPQTGGPQPGGPYPRGPHTGGPQPGSADSDGSGGSGETRGE